MPVMSFLRKTFLILSENSWLHQFIMSHGFSKNMASRFIAGETLQDAVQVIQMLNKKGMTATFDHLGENVRTEEEALHASEIYFQILEKIQETKISSNVSLKMTEMGLDLNLELARLNLEKILAKAAELNNFIRIDMESSNYTEKTLALFKQVYSSYKNVGVVIQAYLYRSEKDIDDLIQIQARVRLCKGAYSEPPDLAFPKKADVDRNYIKLIKKLLLKGNYPAFATHDPRMIEAVKKTAQENRITPDRFEFQMLYGIRRDLQEQLVQEGYNLRIYVPYGTMWYPYFMRRLAERPANLLFFLKNLAR
jgi:proline dehydrogenase